jgi:hypothetical protein
MPIHAARPSNLACLRSSEGFLALIGWDILLRCTLTCNGPTREYSLLY